MFKTLLSYFWKTPPAEASLTLDEAYGIVNDCEVKPSEEKPKPEVEETIELGNYEIFNKIGKITAIGDDNQYTVDDKYIFQSDLDDLLVGTKISYQVIKSSGTIKVVDVHIIENDWNVVDTGKRTWHARTLICTVIARSGRLITLNPGEISVNLNEIQAEFIPIVGDWVELDIKCEVDESVVDLSGKVIEINRLLPLRPQVKLGKITQWDSNSNTGLMDKNIFLNRDSLHCGYIPVIGDTVVAEIIESNHENCAWRALKVVPDYLHSKENKNLNTLKDEDFEETHNTLSITDNITLTFTKLGEVKLFTIEIQSEEEIQLVCMEFPKINGQCQPTNNIDHYTLKANQPLTIHCQCKAKFIGENREIIIFYFDRFKIRRWITVNVATNFVPKNNLKKNQNSRKPVVSRSKREVIRGQKINASARFTPFHMPEFAVPERLFNLLTKYDWQGGNILKSEVEKMKSCLVTTLNYMNFEDKFHTLLHLEEIQVIREMRNYDQERACFIKNGEYLLLEIENLAERRPSVIQGDRVMARSIQDNNSPEYEGYIHKTSKNHLYIKFSQIFHDSYNGEDYSIYIVASRVTFKRKHLAVNLAVRNLGKDLLFPSKVVEKEPQLEFIYDSYVSDKDSMNNLELFRNKPSHNIIGKKRLLEKIRKFHESNDEVIIPVPKLEWYNRSLNYYQKEAVRNILLGVCRPLPYIIFGPPGTGKTVTLVETILQILRLIPHSRLLVCAPSNSAADLLALRLIDSGVLKPGDLIRLVALTAIPSIPSKLAPYCATANIEREGTETSLPVVTTNGLVMGYSSAVLGRHRITVSTCSTAAVLYNLGFSKGHFSHIVIDEAGQTSEPSVLIPLAFLDVSSGQAVLAGDPMQLGPIVLSHLASHYGLEESFLERISNRFPYSRDPDGFPKTSGYDPRLITKLIYNYRALPTLLKLPSFLFYNDDLMPTISEEDSKEADILQKLKEMLPRTKEGNIASIVFHGVLGENFQTEDSPSWFNPSEASQVFYYVNELYRLGLKSGDIGIITPYKAQTKQLLDLFKEAEFDIPRIGTVEEFQGQEFNVVILSTVRSNKKYVATDIKYTMGFIASPRRLNVSITRAKALLIIVGNPDLLLTDRCWRSVINYCIEKGGFIGSPTQK